MRKYAKDIQTVKKQDYANQNEHMESGLIIITERLLVRNVEQSIVSRISVRTAEAITERR